MFINKNKRRFLKIIFIFLFITNLNNKICFCAQTSNSLSTKELALIGHNELLNELDLFIHTYQQKNINPNIPFVEKLLVNSTAKIILFGDIHGDICSLIDALIELQRQNFLDKEFNLYHPNTYIIFLGDYVDHKNNSIEVLYTLMKLFNQNPGKIWIIRGNHEDASRCTSFQKELDKKFCNIDKNMRYKIFSFFNYMPLALFVGCYNNGLTNFIQFCHGGIEIGYNAQAFLETDQLLQQITKLERSKGLDSLELDDKDQALKDSAKSIEAIFSGNKNEKSKALNKVKEEMSFAMDTGYIFSNLYFCAYKLYYKEDFMKGLCNLLVDIDNTENYTLSQLRMGLAWNSFGDLSEFISNRKDLDILWCAGILNFGKKSTTAFLHKNSSQTKILRSIIRGHQHIGKTGKLLTNGKGLYKLWNGEVFTLVSAPHLTPPQYYNSFAILNITPDYKDWTLNHFYSNNGKPFTLETINMFKD